MHEANIHGKTRKRMRNLAEIGKHPWQQPEFIEENRKQKRGMGQLLRQGQAAVEGGGKRGGPNILSELRWNLR
jgi:hypothetical protein